MKPFVAGLIAALLTLFDLDEAFYVPSKLNRRLALSCWWWGFVLLNGLLAGGLYVLLSDQSPLKTMDPWLRAVVVGLGFRALILAKFTTISVGGEKVPLGPEILYDRAKMFVYTRINDIAKKARIDEAVELIGRYTLEEWVVRANSSVLHDAVMSEAEKRSLRDWISRIAKDKATTDYQKREFLLIFIQSGRRPDSA